MKKIICILLALFITGSVSFAQDKPAKPAKGDKAKTDGKGADMHKKTTPEGDAKSGGKDDKKPAAHVKKDGTPDKRFKENKDSKPVHMKKDGTPDKRFKENKEEKKKEIKKEEKRKEEKKK